MQCRFFVYLWALLLIDDVTALEPESSPMSPADSLAAIQVDPGFQVELVAAEPLVRDPVSLDWGADGKLWVVEMADYPYGMDGQGKPGGRVRFLTDSDGDGQYDTSTLFLDGLTFPTGVMVWRQGVLITAAPDILYAEDRDGDGVADHREVLFTGFMEGNQQLRVNGLHWGLDNRVHCANGGHHPGFGANNQIRVPSTGVAIPLGSRDLRFDPDSLQLEALSGPSQFGRVRDDWGRWFGVQNSFPLWHYVLEDRYLKRNAFVPARDSRKQLRLPSNPPVFSNKSLQKRFHSFEQSGRFTSACGPSIYRDEVLFPRLDGEQHAFTCEPFHNVVQHHLLKDEGVSFVGERAQSKSETDFFASADRWCRPVQTRTGPDGALWVVDMYRYMIEHPDWLPPEGREELKPFYRFGDDRGRIYRIKSVKAPTAVFPRLDQVPLADVVEQLVHSNGVIRDLAHRLLVQSKDPTVSPLLETLVKQHRNPLSRLHALSILHGLNELRPSLLSKCLADSHSGMRVQALRVVESLGADDPSLRKQAQAMASDSAAKVRLQLACVLGSWNDEASGEALARLAGDQEPYMVAAVLSSAPAHFDALITALKQPEIVANEALVVGLLKMYPDNGAAADRILSYVLPAKEEAREARHFRLLGHWVSTMRGRGRNTVPPELDQLRQEATMTLADPQADVALREAALVLVEDAAALLTLLRPQETAGLQQAIVRAIGKKRQNDLGKALLKPWSSLSPAVRSTVLEALLGHREWTVELLSQLETDSIQARDIDAVHRQRLLKHSDKALAKRAQLVFQEVTSTDTAKLAKRRGVLALEGVASKGQAHFVSRCAICHQLGELGKAIGPDLKSLTNLSAEALYNSVLAPNLAVDPGYVAYNATLIDGASTYGMIAGETGNSLIFKALDGSSSTILRTSIQAMQSTGFSFMPEGLDDGLSDQDLADLIRFIQQETSDKNTKVPGS